uniref:(3R)-3-hydroxyacyl-CoA dehydrogenase n=1 Tax=Ixodes ricinus TaxID=34613 RepID=A0A147BHQ1_IXORI
MLLSGRLALVTGAGSGIGRCVCMALAADGAIVVAADLNLENAMTTINMLPGSEDHLALPVDVSDSVSVADLFDKIKARCHVPLSIVVNSAGLSRAAEFINTSEELFDTLIAVNLKGTFLVSQLAARTMVSDKTSNCAIVNIGSVVAKSGLKNNSAYVASKAGVTGLTKSMALELAPSGIRVNAVLPGLVETPMVMDYTTEKARASVAARTPLGRLGKPEEIANVVAFLCRPCSSLVTGAIVEVSGGLHM